jgi:MarR family transcriptional regulator, negative regulator of the multidrug operon emrRAB
MLGAVALRLADEMVAVTTKASGLNETAAAALIVLTRQREEPIEYLRRVLALSHPATVRLIDRLEEAGLVVRRPGIDGRTVVPVLTRAGAQKARAVAKARAVVLEQALQQIDRAGYKRIAALLESLLRAAPKNREDASNLCRLCDLEACNNLARCPVDEQLKVVRDA